jgi:[protein-PII] uridylyltransferase
MSTAQLRASVVDAKRLLAEGRAKLKIQHQSGSPGVQVCAKLTDLLDEVVLMLFNSALADLPAEQAETLQDQVALVPNGGYGRRDVAPFSDVDLMILYASSAEKFVGPLAKRLMHDVFDSGLILGHAVRTPQQACKMAWGDATIFTSLVESRLLTGSAELYERFHTRFARQSHRRWRSLYAAMAKARDEERQQFGETVYLLEPNVKRSQGGLRDIQLLRWLGFARYRNADPEALAMMGELTRKEHGSLRDAREFLLRLRNELHFFAEKSTDTLDRAEQMRIAEVFGYRGTEGLLAVEQFMREYFRHTQGINQLVARFMSRTSPGTRWLEKLSPLFSHQVEGDFRVAPRRIYATRQGLKKMSGDLSEVLRMMTLASLYDKQIAPSTIESLHRTTHTAPAVLTHEATQRFLSLISRPARLGTLLRQLHELGTLETIIPAFEHARCLLQFNEYHKYTVDEHSFRAVENATALMHTEGPVARAYQSLAEKRTLHLALLIHDLGKGYVEDHSEVGARIAEEIAQRLKLPALEADTLRFLVLKHLTMAHLAFRRDTSDPQVVIRFAVEVGSPEVLKMLYILTVCDISAVGPGVWNDWKAEVLNDLYNRAMEQLSGESPSGTVDELVQQRKTAVAAGLKPEDDLDWFGQQIDALPPHYLNLVPPEQIVGELRQLHQLKRGEVSVAGRWLPETKMTEYTVGTYEQLTPGIFYKLTGALSGRGLQILSAEINTLAHGLVFDRFFVNDPDYQGPPAADRIANVGEALRNSLLHPGEETPTFRKLWKAAPDRNRESLSQLETQVRIDNSTSDRYTIIDVFAHDRIGLLYSITRTLFRLGLSVSLAKISTYLDQVVDVFYVTDEHGKKISAEPRRREIREQLLAALALKEPVAT